MMTKKDYIKFADMIAQAKSDAIWFEKNQDYLAQRMFQISLIQDDMIALFKSDNPNFDETRFNEYIERKVKSLMEG